jgi:2-keto-4-pentenoate hydratase/2-oxohepta-3-ene-1,7-dioic acid hydratase in catechol pathway
MKLFTYRHGPGARTGAAIDDRIGLDLQAADPDLPAGMKALFSRLDRVADLVAEHAERLAGSPDAAGDPASPLLALDGLLLLPPVPDPQKIIGVGLNYREHAEEQNRPLPAAPMLFSKAVSCLQAPHGPILLDADLTRVDAEAELAVVIGRAGRAIARDRALEHVAGYTCMNDVSDREAQHADKQFFRGKSIDTGGPCGPWIVTPDEVPPRAHGLRVTARWNGELMQDSSTEQLIFPVDQLVSHASRHMTLLPGDIITTGTPSGVGVFRDPPVFLKPGDVVEVEVEGIGKLVNPVLAHPG